MKRHFLLVATLTAVLLLGLLPAGAVAQDGLTTQVCLAIDGSGSITEEDWPIMTDGIADAIRDEKCVPHDGTMELTVVQFARDATVEVGPVVITAANAGTVADQVAGIAQMDILFTNMWDAFETCTAALTGSPNFGSGVMQYINISTDGVPSEEGPPYQQTLAARNNAIAAGIDEIDLEAIGPGVDQPLQEWYRANVVYPQPGIIVTGPPPRGGWVRVVADAQEFSATVCDKFPPPPEEEDGFVPEAGTIVLLASGLMGMAGYAGLRLRKK